MFGYILFFLFQTIATVIVGVRRERFQDVLKRYERREKLKKIEAKHARQRFTRAFGSYAHRLHNEHAWVGPAHSLDPLSRGRFDERPSASRERQEGVPLDDAPRMMRPPILGGRRRRGRGRRGFGGDEG